MPENERSFPELTEPRIDRSRGVSRPVMRYHGGKWRLADWIIGFFPRHRVYTEPFGGAASVLMRKPRAGLVEVYNDLDGEIVSLFKVLRDPESSAALTAALRFTPFARDEFRLSYEPADDAVEQARRTLVRSFMGFGSDSASGATTGFRANGNRNTTHPATDWSNLPGAIAAFCARLTGVVIENRPAVEVMRQHDRPDTLHYCDPPYVPDSRSAHVLRANRGYRHEMTESDHRELADVLRGLQGMVIVSGYDTALYDGLFSGWQRASRRTLADGALERTEVLWMNPRCAAGLRQQALF